MLIAIDASHIYRDRGGIGRLIAGLITGLKSLPEHEYIVVSREDLGLDLPENFSTLIIPAVPKYLGGGLAWYWKLGRILRKRKVAGLICATLNLAPVFYDKCYCVINDLTPLDHPEYYNGLFNQRYRIILGLTVRFAKQLIAISEATAAKLENLFSLHTKVPVVKLGLDEWSLVADTKKLAASAQKELKEKYDLPEHYFFSLSTLQPRKNYERMIEAFALFLEDHPDFYYLISGRKGWQYESIFETIERLGLQERVRHIDFAPDEDMAFLFDHAEALMFVSLDEGFGIPVIQSLARGIPVVTSDIPVLRELAYQDRVFFADPLDTDHIAAAMDDAVELRRTLDTDSIREMYSWGNTAKDVLATIFD